MKRYFPLCFILVLALLISSCEVVEYQATSPKSGIVFGGDGIEELSVFNDLMNSARNGYMDESDVIWLAKKLQVDVGIDIKTEKASSFKVLNGKDFVCVFGEDTIYYFDDTEPGEEEEKSFEDCVADCIKDCMEGVDPEDPNYQIEWKLCNRSCRINCAQKRNPNGRFSRRRI